MYRHSIPYTQVPETATGVVVATADAASATQTGKKLFVFTVLLLLILNLSTTSHHTGPRARVTPDSSMANEGATNATTATNPVAIADAIITAPVVGIISLLLI